LTNFFPKIIQHEENDEEDNGEDQGKADAALRMIEPSGAPMRNITRQATESVIFFMPGDLVIAQVVPLGLEHHGRLIQAAPQPVQYGQLLSRTAVRALSGSRSLKVMGLGGTAVFLLVAEDVAVDVAGEGGMGRGFSAAHPAVSRYLGKFSAVLISLLTFTR